MSSVKTTDHKKIGKLFVISAPSGCGKTTLCKKLLNDKLGLVHSISVTTRPARKGETDGIDYHFVSKKTFEEKIRRSAFLEYEENFGHLYGTPRSFIEESLKKGKSILLSIDVKGAMKVKNAFPEESVHIFILPPSIAALKKRLSSRMTDEAQDISTRLKVAKGEIAYKDLYDFRVVNDRLDRAYSRLKRIVLQNL